MIARNRPYLDASEILAALRPGTGRSEFESAVADRVGARFAVAFAYGHAGLIAALRALGLTEIDVILPAYTCTVVADAVVACGNRPVFADIELTDFNMSLDAIKDAITPQTRAIIATHMYGYPTDVDAIRESVGDERVLIIEDRALGILTYTPGTVGLRGDIGLFSFGIGKHLFTVQGGIIATDSAELYEKIVAYRDREMANHPITLPPRRWARLLLSYHPFGRNISLDNLRGKMQGAQPVRRSAAGVSSNSTLVASDHDSAYTDFQARIGLSQLRKLDYILQKRESLAKLYDRELQNAPDLTPAPIISGANYSHYTVLIRQRDEIGFRERMRAKGVDVGQMYDQALPLRERFRPFTRQRYPNAERAAREVVNLPLHVQLRMSEAQYASECVRQILRRCSDS